MVQKSQGVIVWILFSYLAEPQSGVLQSLLPLFTAFKVRRNAFRLRYPDLKSRGCRGSL